MARIRSFVDGHIAPRLPQSGAISANAVHELFDAGARRSFFYCLRRRTPTANAEGPDLIGKAAGETPPLGTFRSTRVLGVRRRHAPRYLKKQKDALGPPCLPELAGE